MPVDNTRILALIRAGEHFAFQTEALRQALRNAGAAVASGQAGPSEALAELLLHLGHEPDGSTAAIRVLAHERAHYDATHRETAKRKERNRRRRARQIPDTGHQAPGTGSQTLGTDVFPPELSHFTTAEREAFRSIGLHPPDPRARPPLGDEAGLASDIDSGEVLALDE